ncbi:hypothetical protein EXIGLDRAFT_726281 [Exidia glandulosa HHB12029]|uniref:F-box domain-containing protein n=1 Tax=Exidia glandulosa HHB12029 TaxID=1314781 RepID=A0A165DTJ5_EXIGL|nr:hypothetical protein EXIGLDRAFT_726281 [Exidia glandulosa HHB12029]
MSRMRLSPDVLSDIFLEIDGGIDGAFVVAQVCSSWRSTAFSSPLLWSTVSVTDFNFTRIPTSLALSQDLPLSIELLHIIPSVIEELVPHQHRIASLFISYTDGDGVYLKPLLCAGLEFRALQVLRATAERNNQLHFDVALSAPLLRELELYGVALDNWKVLFTSNVTEICLSGCSVDTSAAQLGLLLQDCANLERLSVGGPYGPQPGEFVPEGGVLSNLRYIELQTDFNTTSDVLRLVRSGVVVREMDVQFPDIDLDRDTFTRRLFGAFIGGLDSTTEFTFHWSNMIKLRDTHGRVRRMHPANDDHYWPWPELWLELDIHLGLHATLQTIHIGSPYWNSLAYALSKRPLTSPDVEIHVGLYSDVIGYEEAEYSDDEDAVSEGPRVLTCNGLRKLVFKDDGYYAYEAERGLSRAYVVCAYVNAVVSARPSIEICVTDAGMEKDEEPTSLETFRRKLTGARVLCQHCASRM